MKNKKLNNLVCGLVSAAVLTTAVSAPAVFAAGENNNETITATDTVLTDETTEATASPEPSATAEPEEPTVSPEPTATPGAQEMDMKVTATVYTTDEDDVYKVVFKTASSLPEILGFELTATFDTAEINSVSFGESFAGNGETSKSITDDKTITYVWKNGSTALSGAVVLSNASVTSKNKITSHNMSIDKFTATLKDGSELIINPTLSVVEGTNMPDLTEKEQSSYDALMALPEISALTFYKDEEKDDLYDISSYYSARIDTAVELYDSMMETSKKRIDTALSISNKSITDFYTLQKAAKAMQEVSGIMQMPECYDGITDDSSALNYEYLKTTFDNLSTSVPSALKRAAKATEEYNEVVSKLTDYNKYIETALKTLEDKTAENYNTKIASLEVQYSKANSFSLHTLYKTYLSSLKTIAQSLYDDVNKNYSGTYKEYMLSSIEKIINKIEDGNVVSDNLPIFSITNGINIGYSWSVSVKRRKAIIDQDATVQVYAYNSKGEVIQNSSEKAFKAGDESVSVSLPSTTKMYKTGDVVHVKCYYKYNDISYYLGEDTVTAYKTVNPNKNQGGSTGGNTGGDTNGSGTVYPSSAPTEPDPTKAPNFADENPYTDLDGYDWALESIIGLTNAGIVNGMGDNKFDPSGNVTREQFCKMVVQMFGLDATDTTSHFNDVDETKWYAPYVTAAVNAGYVQGQSDEYFGIGEVIMRQDMATILYRAINKSGDGVILEFTDNSDIAAYAKDAVAELVGLGVMNGYEDGSFKPRGSATRAEASKVIYGTYKIVK